MLSLRRFVEVPEPEAKADAGSNTLSRSSCLVGWVSARPVRQHSIMMMTTAEGNVLREPKTLNQLNMAGPIELKHP
jgi:hypothetical protein